MRLKKVEITGFKSFMDKTVLLFEQGVTAIVGPNGCGKSNIVDAIRWAMGEASAKALRGQGMEDVIFHGTDAQGPLGMAEVSLTFENVNGHAPAHLSGCSEIEVTRRLFRSGESEYCINKVPCRRRDVWELFMDTGLGNRSYAIVEQDRVSRIISARPEERRVVVEEVAGISRYKSRREAAQRKMEATAQNLERIRDIRNEVGQQIKSLERQARKAERYKSLKAQILDLERGSVLRRWALLDRERSLVQVQIRELGLERDRLNSLLEGGELGLEKEKMLLLDTEKKLLEAQEELHRRQRALHDLENLIQRESEEASSLETSGRIWEKEISQLKIRLESTRERLVSLTSEREGICTRLQETLARLDELAGLLKQGMERARLLKASLEESRLELVEWMGERARLKNALQHHRKRSEELQKSLEKGKAEQEGLARKLEEMNLTGSCLEGEIRELEEALGQLRARREQIKEKLSGLQAQREELRARLQDLGSSIQGIGSRMQALQGLQLDLAGFSEGIRALREAARRGEIHLGDSLPKVVAEVVDASDGADGLISALLGERIQYLVVENWEQALRGLAFAKEKGLGRVGFVALEECGKSSPKAGNGDENRLGLCWEPGYEPVGGLFLEGATLVSRLEEAINRGLSGIGGRLVTPQGDLLDPRGLLEGGGDPRDPSKGYLARRRELKDLEASLKKLEEASQGLAGQERELSQGISSLSLERDSLVELIHAKELRLAECRRDFLSSKEAAGGLRQRLEALKWQLGGQSEELGLLCKSLQEDSGRLEDLESRIGSREKDLQALEQEHAKALAGVEELRSEVTRVQVMVASLQERSNSLEREIHGLKAQEKELSQECSRKEVQKRQGLQRLQQLRGSLAEAREELGRLMESHRGAAQDLEKARMELQEKRENILRMEGVQQSSRQRIRALESELKRIELKERELALRMEHAQGELQGRLEMELEEIPAAAKRATLKDSSQEEAQIASLKEALDLLGDVNLVAAEQYKELKQRYDSLSAQQEDLENSIALLRKAIQRIDRSSRKRFREAFNRLDEEFRKVFPILFEGGEAHLALTQAEDILDAGVEIVARPPGKRLQNISLLSGGEKALAAVALIFAMIRIKETPFCLFDEVDAPLDEANIDRFNKMVRELSRKSQFILVTHSKRTMEMADVLYGVTMETPGVSRMISVRLQ